MQQNNSSKNRGARAQGLDTPHASGAIWSHNSEHALKTLQVEADKGLNQSEISQRQQLYGPNVLTQQKSVSIWRLFLKQFKSLIMALLSVAACVAFWFDDYAGAVAIGVVIVINVLIAFFMELSAVKAMATLAQLGSVSARVLRSGEQQQVSAENLVPGDILLLDAGDVSPADSRIIEANKLQADESSLTGESLPVSKAVKAVTPDTQLANRSSMLYRGTSITRGSGRAVVSAIGKDTELGAIADMVAETQEESTPLEQKLNTLAHKLIWVTLGITVIVVISGTLAGKDPALMIETGLALAVAAIPEGLPIVATIALARGMYRMAQQKALVSRLASVETLGATGVICTDKTGTLTENVMTVDRLILPDEQYASDRDTSDSPKYKKLKNGQLSDAARRAMEIAVLCSNAEITQNNSSTSGTFHGDPLEVALLKAAINTGVERSALISNLPEVREEPFDSTTRMMATVHQSAQGYRVVVKGAPEEIIAAASEIMLDGKHVQINDSLKTEWLAKNENMASDGLRVIALAEKTVAIEDCNVYEDLTLVGLIGLLDPPRKEVTDAIKQCRAAGIEVVMMTGDQTATARHIGKIVGVLDDSDDVIHGSELGIGSAFDSVQPDSEQLLRARAFSRVSPQQKLDLIALHQNNGQIVAMTGDGVNDAPALKKADIGVAMGQRGTQVAREASEMVLQDDSFATIVSAIKQGRIIFSNIRLFALYLLSCNVSEVMIVGLAAVFGGALPLMPLQILFLNLVTDVFPALALGVGAGTNDMMSARPRPADEPLLGKREWLFVVIHGASITISVMGAFLIARYGFGLTGDAAVTVSFFTLALTQLWHIFNLRETGSKLFRNQITHNPFVWLALSLCVLILLVAFTVPQLAQVLNLTSISLPVWGLIGVASALPLLFGQIALLLRLPFTVRAAM